MALLVLAAFVTLASFGGEGALCTWHCVWVPRVLDAVTVRVPPALSSALCWVPSWHPAPLTAVQFVDTPMRARDEENDRHAHARLGSLQPCAGASIYVLIR